MTTSDKNCHTWFSIHGLLRDRKHWLLSHSVISIFFAFSVTVAMLLVWYPTPWLGVLGGMRLLLVVFGVDAVLGPVLMWLLYHPEKKTRKALILDVCFVLILQLGALCYGLHVLLNARPAFVVFAVDRLEVVQAGQVSVGDGDKYAVGLWRQPQLVFLDKPKVLDDIAWQTLIGGKDLFFFPKYYANFDNHLSEVLAKSVDLEAFRKLIQSKGGDVTSLTRFSNDPNIRAMPITVRDQFLTALLDYRQKEIVAVLNIDFWELK